MPYRFYYGNTGRVWNISRRAVGVELLKTVGNRKRTKKSDCPYRTYSSLHLSCTILKPNKIKRRTQESCQGRRCTTKEFKTTT